MSSRRNNAAKLLGGAAVGLAAGLALRNKLTGRDEHQSETEDAYLAAKHKILVLGAGFGGLQAILAMDKRLRDDPDTDILLIDRSNDLFFTPLMWTVANGQTNPNNVVVPIRAFQKGRKFHVLHAEIQGIDIEKRQVHTSEGVRPYDTLIIDLGSVTSIPDLPGLREHAKLFRTPVEALQMRNTLIEAVESAHGSSDPDKRAAWLTFVVSGGGDTGVELAATIHEYLHHGLLAAYPWLRDERMRVVLVGHADKLIPMSTPESSAAVRRVLEQQGIEIRTGVSVNGATATTVQTSQGDIPARTLFWAAGITAPPIVKSITALEHAKNGSVLVDEYLRAKGHPEVFVVGDAAWAFDGITSDPIPPTAQAAEHEGRYIGNAIVDQLQGIKTQPFRFKPLGHLSLLGAGTGVAQVGSRVVTGFPAWVMWHGYYLSHIPSWRNRIRLSIDWALSYLLGREVAQIPLDTRA